MDFSSPSKKSDKQDGHPEASFAFTALLKNSMGNKLLSFFDEMVKPALQRNEQQIAATYQKISSFIDQVHDHVQKKLQQHQQQVFQIVREEMAEAHREAKQLACDLNKKITQRNQNEEVWFLSNQLDYFKNEALKLFSINKQLKIKNKLLAKTIKDYEIQFQSFDLTLQKLKKQSMKQKSIKRIERPSQTMRESSCIKLRKKESHQAKKRMVTELSSIMRTEVEKTGKEFDDSRINIQLSHASNGNFTNSSVAKQAPNNPILITLEDQDKSIENVAIHNFSAHSYKSKRQRSSCLPQSFVRPTFLQEKPILQCFDKQTQTDLPITDQNREELLQETNQSKTNYDLNLFRNGFRLNATHMKTKRIEIPLRNSVDYQKRGDNNIRSMNSSFLRNRIEEASKYRNKGNILKQGGLFVAK